MIAPTAPALSAALKAEKKEPVRIYISLDYKQEAYRLFGLSLDDRRWEAITMATLITDCHENRPTRMVNCTYFFYPVKIKKGAMYQMRGKAALKQSEQRYFLSQFHCHY